MKKTILMILTAALLVAVLAACGGRSQQEAEEPARDAAPAQEAAPAGEVTWEDYQNWLIDTFAETSPDPEGFAELIRSFGSWDEVDPAAQPLDKILGEETYNASTFDEFVAAGGVGTYNTDYVDDFAGGEPSGEGSGEPTGEPSEEPPA